MSQAHLQRLAAFLTLLSLCRCGVVATHRLQTSPRQSIVDAARAVGADELIVIQDGRTTIEWTSGNYAPPHQLMSITKSVVALALGALVDNGSLRTTDTLDKYYPTLNHDPRGKISVDQILTMTSGLGSTFPQGDVDTDCIHEALQQPLLHDPGTEIFYNNDAVNLLSGIVEKITGMSLQEYVDRVLLAPLGIRNWSWYSDAQGHTWVMTGLALHPSDLARIGQLVLNHGVLNGKQIISEEWIDGLFTPTRLFSGYGRLWLMGTEGFPSASERLRARGAQFVYGSGDCNQILVLDKRTRSLLVLQTERLARPDSDLVFPDLEPVLEAFVAMLPRKDAPVGSLPDP